MNEARMIKQSSQVQRSFQIIDYLEQQIKSCDALTPYLFSCRAPPPIYGQNLAKCSSDALTLSIGTPSRISSVSVSVFSVSFSFRFLYKFAFFNILFLIAATTTQNQIFIIEKIKMNLMQQNSTIWWQTLRKLSEKHFLSVFKCSLVGYFNLMIAFKIVWMN